MPRRCYNRGSALAGLGRLEEALAAYDRALALRPDYGKARIGRGAALAALNRHQDALEEYATVLAADKNNADAQHNEALSLLTLGDYRRGFQKYEARWLRTGMPRRKSLGKPLWLGEYPLARKTILVHAEQGLGDTIQFARYAPPLARGGAKVVLEVQPELVALLSRLEGVAGVVARGDALPAYDVHCPAGSLPLALRTERREHSGGTCRISRPSEERVAKWRERHRTPAGAAHRDRLVGQRRPCQRPQPLDRARAAGAVVRGRARELRQHPARIARRRCRRARAACPT